MGKTERSEDMKWWEILGVLVREIYRVAEEGKLAKAFDIRNQLRGCTFGYEYKTRKHFLI